MPGGIPTEPPNLSPYLSLWGIAFACVLGYSGNQEVSLVSAQLFASQIVDVRHVLEHIGKGARFVFARYGRADDL